MTSGLARSARTLGVLERYRDLLPVTPQTPMVTLGEGGTPLVRSRRLVDRLGCAALHFDNAAEGERVFNALAQDGKVQMPFQPTFWAKGFGMAIDRFGTPWIVNAEQTV